MGRIVEADLHVARKRDGAALANFLLDLFAEGQCVSFPGFLLRQASSCGDGSILRGADKHFDEIVVQAVVELVLQMPGELRMIEVAGMNRKHVGVNWDGRVFQIDQHFDHAVVFSRGKSEQRMIVEPQVIENFLQGVGLARVHCIRRDGCRAKSREVEEGRPSPK